MLGSTCGVVFVFPGFAFVRDFWERKNQPQRRFCAHPGPSRMPIHFFRASHLSRVGHTRLRFGPIFGREGEQSEGQDEQTKKKTRGQDETPRSFQSRCCPARHSRLAGRTVVCSLRLFLVGITVATLVPITIGLIRSYKQ